MKIRLSELRSIIRQSINESYLDEPEDIGIDPQDRGGWGATHAHMEIVYAQEALGDLVAALKQLEQDPNVDPIKIENMNKKIKKAQDRIMKLDDNYRYRFGR